MATENARTGLTQEQEDHVRSSMRGAFGSGRDLGFDTAISVIQAALVDDQPMRNHLVALLLEMKINLGREVPQITETWPDPSPPTKGVSSYDYIKANGFTIEWKSWKERPSYTVIRDAVSEQFIGDFDTLDEAKAAARAALPHP